MLPVIPRRLAAGLLINASQTIGEIVIIKAMNNKDVPMIRK